MATAQPDPRPRSRYDHTFFHAFAVLIGCAVFIGFAQTYYLSGALKVPAWKTGLGPPHPWIVHTHGAIFTFWVLLLLVQTSLTRAGRVDLHRRLGLLGFALACLVVLSGTAVVCENLARHGGGASQIFWILGFALLIGFGYRQRRNPRAHKRLILAATIMLLPAPLVRWPVLIAGNFPLAVNCCYALLALMACYDVWSSAKVHAATLWGSAAFVVTHYQPIVSLFTRNSAWFRVTTEMKILGHVLR